MLTLTQTVILTLTIAVSKKRNCNVKHKIVLHYTLYCYPLVCVNVNRSNVCVDVNFSRNSTCQNSRLRNNGYSHIRYVWTWIGLASICGCGYGCNFWCPCNSGIISVNHWGVSVYVIYCSCSSNTVSKVWCTGKTIKRVLTSLGP